MKFFKFAASAAALALLPAAAMAQETMPAQDSTTGSDMAQDSMAPDTMTNEPMTHDSMTDHETVTDTTVNDTMAPEGTPPSPGVATTAPAITGATMDIVQGTTVTGNDDLPIGTVTQVTPQAVVVDTGTNKIPLPRDAFSQSDTGLTLNITKTELDSTYSQQMATLEAQVDEKLVAGTPVMTADAQPLGTVDMVEGDNVVLAMDGTDKLTLGKDVFAVDANGGLMVRVTKAQIEQAMAANPAA